MKKGEERHCVDLVVTLTDLIPPFFLPPCYPPNPVPRSLVLPTSSPGNKDFHSCAWGDPQQGRRGGGERWERGGGIKVGRFEDHRDQGRSLKLCGFFFVCIFFFSCYGFNQWFTISDLVATVPLNAHSGKVWWECFQTGPHSRLQHWDKHCSWICTELQNQNISYQISFSAIRSLPAGPDQAFGLQNICALDYCKAAARFNAQQWVSSKRFPPTSTAILQK